MCLQKYTIQYILSSRPVIGQAADTSQSQVCYLEYTVWYTSADTLAYFYKLSGILQLVVISTESSLSKVDYISFRGDIGPSYSTGGYKRSKLIIYPVV